MKKFIALLLCLFAFHAEAAYQPSVPTPLTALNNITGLTGSPMQRPNHDGRITGHSIVLDQFNRIAFPGQHNVAIGYHTLLKNNTGGQFLGGTENIAIGYQALENMKGVTNNGESFANVAIGYQALQLDTTGHANVAIGFQAQKNTTTGIDDICIGYQCLQAQTTGQFNVTMGIYAGTMLTTNGSNTLIGTMAGRYMDAQNNTFIGYQAGCGSGASCPQTTPATMTGSDNVGIGLQALSNLTSGAQNTGLGTGAGGAYTTTSGISMMGYHAGVLCADTGGQVSLFGWAVEAGNTNCANDTAFGYFALGAANGGHDNTAFGNFAAAAVTSGNGNIAIGDGAMAQNVTTGVNNIVIGNWWPASNVSNTIGIGMIAPGSIQVTGSGTLATEVVTLRGAITLTDVTTGTNADVLCLTAGKVVTLQAAGSCTISKRILKENFGPVENATALLMELKPTAFNFKKTSPENADPNATTRQIGFIADEVESVDKRLALYDNDMKTPKSWRQDGVIALLTKGFQEQQEEINVISPGAFPFHKCFFNLLVCPN